MKKKLLFWVVNIVELNKKILKFGLALITLSLIFTVGISFVYSLENPVFLKMYIEQYVSDNENSNVIDSFELKYITNISDRREVIDIQFEEAPNIEVFVSRWPINGGGYSLFNDNTYNNQRGDIYGRYVIHTIYLNIDLNDIDKEFYEIELNNAKVSFDDGSTLDTNLGRIIFYKDKRKSDDIQSRSSSGSSDGTSSVQLETKKDIRLLDVKSPLLEDLKDHLDIYIEDIDYREILGIEYEKNKTLNIHSKFEVPKDIVEKYTFYDIKPKLYYKDEEGNISYIRIYNINHTPYSFDFKGIFNYLRARDVI